MREIESINREVSSLTALAKDFDRVLSSFEHEMREPVHTLVLLDDVKTKMESVNSVLAEAEKYKQLMVTISSVFANGDVLEIANCIQEMNTSSKLLEGVPTFKNMGEKQRQYVEKLEGMIKPGLIKAIESRDHEQARLYSKALSRIQCNISLEDIYFTHRLPPLIALWEKRVLEYKKWSVSNNNQEAFLLDWVPRFYDSMQIEISMELLPYYVTHGKKLAQIYNGRFLQYLWLV